MKKLHRPQDRPAKYRADGRRHFRPPEIYEAAVAYRDAKLSFFPIAADGTKQPAFLLLPKKYNEQSQQYRPTWSVFREGYPTDYELKYWYRDQYEDERPGLAILGGKGSGGLEIIDFDKFETFQEWGKQMLADAPTLFARLVLVRSPRPGVHAYYRTPEFGSNQKLARFETVNDQRGIAR